MVDLSDQMGRADTAMHILEMETGKDSSELAHCRSRRAKAWRAAMAELVAALMVLNATNPHRKKKRT